jgi:hypothetical protein
MAGNDLTAVEQAKPGPMRMEIPDAGVPGLYLVARPSGAVSHAHRRRHEYPRSVGLAFAVASGLFALATLVPRAAQATPAFVKQTGKPCAACHNPPNGGKLTDTGKEFKANGNK